MPEDVPTPAAAGDQRAPGNRSGEPLSYEQARDELVETVRRLEAGGTSLEESLALWQRGEELARVCQHWLDGAREKLAHTVGDPGADDDG